MNKGLLTTLSTKATSNNDVDREELKRLAQATRLTDEQHARHDQMVNDSVNSLNSSI